MRVGDFAVEVVPRKRGSVRETSSGHVLARPGQVYALRLRNFGPLRCVADVRIDGQLVTRGGLVLEGWSTEELERPISEDENGRFTVFAEGDERVFGPDGGRDNADLGLIEVRFRRELPSGSESPRPLPGVDEFGGLLARNRGPLGPPDRSTPARPYIEAIARTFDLPHVAPPQAPASAPDFRDVERAAGTGLTGHSEQRFRPVHIGTLEAEGIVIKLRLVIGTEEAIAERERPHESDAPARPAARP